MSELKSEAIANNTARLVHRAICDSGEKNITMAPDGSITAEETEALINGAAWGIAAFVSQSVVVTPNGQEVTVTPEEVLAGQIAGQFVHAYRSYKQANRERAN